MLDRVKTFWIWINRYSRSRGFGVQSPSAYSFIRFVINEHDPYYAYSELEIQLVMLTRLEHKLGRLFLRLANYWQPMSYCSTTHQYAAYIHAGCRQCVLERNVRGRQLVIVDWIKDGQENFWTYILPRCTKHTLLVVIGIHSDRNCLSSWVRLQENDLTGVTYDLYHCGIVFFDKDIYKQHYKVFF